MSIDKSRMSDWWKSVSWPFGANVYKQHKENSG